jgi:hypothetical protein
VWTLLDDYEIGRTITIVSAPRAGSKDASLIISGEIYLPIETNVGSLTRKCENLELYGGKLELYRSEYGWMLLTPLGKNIAEF